MKILLTFASALLVLASPLGRAATHEQILDIYKKEADPGFTPSAMRGETFFHTKINKPDGKTASCMDCHTSNLKAIGRTKVNKKIEPMAPIVNPQRITDPAKVEKWFRRNCQDVRGRQCTPGEKADFIAFLLSIR
jgi:hypothetical protein